MGITDTQSFSLVIRDVFYDALSSDPFFASYTCRKTKMLSVQPQLLPYLGVYIIDETMLPDGDANAGHIRFSHTLRIGFSAMIANNDQVVAEQGIDAAWWRDHEPAVARSAHHEPAEEQQPGQHHHRRHHARFAPACVRHDAPNEAVITELYVYLSADETGEGICGGMLDGAWILMVTSKRRVAEQLRPMAQHIAKVSGKPVKLVRFTMREEMDARRCNETTKRSLTATSIQPLMRVVCRSRHEVRQPIQDRQGWRPRSGL